MDEIIVKHYMKLNERIVKFNLERYPGRYDISKLKRCPKCNHYSTLQPWGLDKELCSRCMFNVKSNDFGLHEEERLEAHDRVIEKLKAGSWVQCST